MELTGQSDYRHLPPEMEEEFRTACGQGAVARSHAHAKPRAWKFRENLDRTRMNPWIISPLPARAWLMGGLLLPMLLAAAGCGRHGKAAPVGGSDVPPSKV